MNSYIVFEPLARGARGQHAWYLQMMNACPVLDCPRDNNRCGHGSYHGSRPRTGHLADLFEMRGRA